MYTVQVLTDYVRTAFKTTLATAANLTAHGEINRDVLYTILVPRTIMVTTDSVTRELRAMRLISVDAHASTYDLLCESVDAYDTLTDGDVAFGKVRHTFMLSIDGTVKIKDLNIYPLEYHPDSEGLRRKLLARGKKWASLRGVHHMQYESVASITTTERRNKTVRYNVSDMSRQCIDEITHQCGRRLTPVSWSTAARSSASNHITSSPSYKKCWKTR